MIGIAVAPFLATANDGTAFATTGADDNNSNKKKEVTCYKCKKTGHYAN